MTQELVRYSKILSIVGDILQVQVPEAAEGETAVVRFKDLAIIEQEDGSKSLAQVIDIVRDAVSLQIFTGTKGVSTSANVTRICPRIRRSTSAGPRSIRSSGSCPRR